MPNGQQKPFEIGLVLAGAVSAGAYSAGVLDFLFEALQAWYKKFDGHPPHEVKIRVMTGSSAGGMCSGISTLQFLDSTDFEKRQSSRLYDSWVNQVDIGPMLTTRDLEDGKVRSLLNSDIIDTIANKAFEITPGYDHLPHFVADDFHLLLTVTNTRGVSYAVNFETETAGHPYIITNYGDFFHFSITKPGATPQKMDPKYVSPYGLDPNNTGSLSWKMFKEMCKATGAFPLGLRARVLEQSNTPMYGHMFGLSKPIGVPQNESYKFIGIDGGVINNEPFEMAHDILAGGVNKSNVREPGKATRAIIMVDPFPASPIELNYNAEATDLASVAQAFLGSLMGQALFKPEDLQPAMEKEVRSRFLISPKRSIPQGTGNETSHLACGAIGAFSGFIDRSFRQADYELGRRNGQQFLRKHFLLSETNPLFSGWTTLQKTELKVAYGKDLPDGELPIVPLDENLLIEISEPPWPSIPIDVFESKIKEPLFLRVKEIGSAYIKNWFADRAWRWWLHRLPAQKVYDTFESSLRKAKLLV